MIIKLTALLALTAASVQSSALERNGYEREHHHVQAWLIPIDDFNRLITQIYDPAFLPSYLDHRNLVLSLKGKHSDEILVQPVFRIAPDGSDTHKEIMHSLPEILNLEGHGHKISLRQFVKEFKPRLLTVDHHHHDHGDHSEGHHHDDHSEGHHHDDHSEEHHHDDHSEGHHHNDHHNEHHHKDHRPYLKDHRGRSHDDHRYEDSKSRWNKYYHDDKYKGQKHDDDHGEHDDHYNHNHNDHDEHKFNNHGNLGHYQSNHKNRGDEHKLHKIKLLYKPDEHHNRIKYILNRPKHNKNDDDHHDEHHHRENADHHEDDHYGEKNYNKYA